MVDLDIRSVLTRAARTEGLTLDFAKLPNAIAQLEAIGEDFRDAFAHSLGVRRPNYSINEIKFVSEAAYHRMVDLIVQQVAARSR